METAINQVTAYLGSNLATHVGAVNTARADSITISTPTLYESQQPVMQQLPFLMALGDASLLTTEDPSSMKTRHDMSLIVVEQAQSHDELQARLYRQIEALVKCLRAGRFTTGPKAYFQRRYAGFSPVYTFSRDRFRQDAQLYIWVELTEND